LKKITAIGNKEEGKAFEMVSRIAFKNSLDELPIGKYKLTIEKYYNKSTPPQFGWLYGCIYPLSFIALNDAGYEFTNIDQIDMFWRAMFANKQLLNRETGEIMLIPESKSEFLTVNQMTYCESIRQYCAEYLGVDIPDPNVRWREGEKE